MVEVELRIVGPVKSTDGVGHLEHDLVLGPEHLHASGSLVSPSIAIRTWLIKELASFGSSTSSYAGRPATSTALSLVTAVVGSSAFSTR